MTKEPADKRSVAQLITFPEHRIKRIIIYDDDGVGRNVKRYTEWDKERRDDAPPKGAA